MAIYDELIFKAVRDAEDRLEQKLNADILYLNSEIRMNIFAWFRETIEKLAQRKKGRTRLQSSSRPRAAKRKQQKS
jgi:hypothetical protein